MKSEAMGLFTCNTVPHLQGGVVIMTHEIAIIILLYMQRHNSIIVMYSTRTCIMRFKQLYS